MTALEKLQETALALLFSSQAHPVGFASLHIHNDTSLASILSDKELQLLALHDKLQRLTLERRILEAHKDAKPSPNADADIHKKLINAKANRRLKETVIETTLITKPILNAVHGADEPNARERGLVPLLHRRDRLTLTHANMAQILVSAREKLSKVEKEYVQLQERNRILAERLLELARKKEEENRKQQGEEYRKVEAKLKESTKRWEVLRQVTQAVVVNSGVDWVRDENLRELVLACGEE